MTAAKDLKFLYKIAQKQNISLNHFQINILQHSLTLINKQLSKGLLGHFSKFISPQKNKGIYLWGEVGRGKTMLIKILAQYLLSNKINYQYFHYHDFLKYIHQQAHIKSAADPICEIAKQIARNKFLFIDEFQLLDISNTMIIKRFFVELWKHDILTFITSNRAPKNLYNEQIGKDLALEFCDNLQNCYQIHQIMGANDYRQRLEQLAEVFLTPNNAENNIKLDNYIKKIVGFVPEYKPHTLKVFNRPIKFTSSYQNILKTDFDELLTRELSQNDYIEICKYYRIVVLQNIPIFSADMHNEAKRFKMFIDQAYNQQIILLLSAETNIDKLYLGGKGSFEFKRTISRLYEMQTESYINTIINSI